MGFEGLLGNERLKENLRRSLAKGHASHFYLISGPKGSGKRTLARLLSAALMCEGETEISEIRLIERGYDDICGKLRGIGADIRKVVIPDPVEVQKAN